MASRIATAFVVAACVWFALQSLPRVSDALEAQKLRGYSSALSKGDVAKARALFDADVRKSPADPGVYMTISTECATAGKYDLAAEYLERATTACKSAPNEARADIYVRLADCYTHLEKTKPQTKAIAAARSALDLQPDQPDKLNAYGYMLADNGVQLDEAERDIVRALKLLKEQDDSTQIRLLSLIGVGIDSEADFIEDSYGWVLYKEGHYAAAVNALDQAISDMPESRLNNPGGKELAGGMYYHLGAACRAAKQPERARSALETAIAYWPGSDEAKAELELLKRETATRPAAPATGGRSTGSIAPAGAPHPPTGPDAGGQSTAADQPRVAPHSSATGAATPSSLQGPTNGTATPTSGGAPAVAHSGTVSLTPAKGANIPPAGRKRQ